MIRTVPHTEPRTAPRRDSAVARPTRAPRSDAAWNRETILTAAAHALNEDADASIETIAARAGLSRRAVYGHFAGRDDLVAEVLARGAARVASSALAVAHPDPLVEIALFGATLWSEVEHVRVMAQLAIRGPHQTRVAAALEPARRQLRATVSRGVAGGALRSDIDPERLAWLIEASAIAVLDEATRSPMSADEGRRLVMLNALSVAGLGWREADELVARAPELGGASKHGGEPDRPGARARAAARTRVPEEVGE